MKFFCPQMLNTNSLDVFTLNPKATQQRSINMQSVYTYIKKKNFKFTSSYFFLNSHKKHKVK